MDNRTNEKWFEKYAWAVFFFIGILVLVGGIPHAFGINTDPSLVETISGKTVEELKIGSPSFFNLHHFYFSGGGLSDVGFAFFLIVVSFFAYRRGEKWAWYAFLFVPLYFTSWVFLTSALPPVSQKSLMTPLFVMIFLSIIGLLVPFRKFFPRDKPLS